MLFELNTDYKFDDKLMEILGIPVIEKIDDHDEVWRYAKYDKNEEMNIYRLYLVSNYGRVYDMARRRLKFQSDTGMETTTGHYKTVSCSFGSMAKNSNYLVHRLVALAFLEPDKERPFVNHIDGIPYHNYLWNLEWCNNSENMLHAVKMGLKNDPKGENRVNAKWTEKEIHMVCQMMAEGHKATYIYNALVELLKDPKVQYERVRTLVKHIKHQTHWTHISSQYDIDFSKFNYAKEKKSVKKEKKRKNTTYVYEKYE